MAWEDVRAWQLRQPIERLNVGVSGLPTKRGKVIEDSVDVRPVKYAMAGRDFAKMPCEDRRRSKVLAEVDGQEPNIKDLVAGRRRHSKAEAHWPPVAGLPFDLVDQDSEILSGRCGRHPPILTRPRRAPSICR